MTTKRSFRKYLPEDMAKAIDAVKNGMNPYAASKQFNVPRVTIINKIKGKSPEVCGMGPAIVLTQGEEARVEKWVFDIAKAGFPVTKEALIDTVAKLVVELKRDHPFTDGRPGKKWFQCFLRRHPKIAMRTAEKLSGHRSILTETQIRFWFSEVLEYLKSNNYTAILQDPSRIFNADETCFSLCPQTGKVLALKGIKNIYDVSKANDKDNVTALFTVSGAGVMAPTMMVYPYKRIPAEIVKSFPDGWGIGKSDTGWMTGETFFEYMANVFYPWLIKENVPRPVIFFVDGHKSHLTMHLTNFLRENGVILVALFPNATHILQPLDVAVFHPLKAKWKQTVKKWATDHNNDHVTKHNIAVVLSQATGECVTDKMIKNGFRVCGLHPFEPNNVDYSKCIVPVPADTIDANETRSSENNTFQQPSDRPTTARAHLEFFENQIPPDIMHELEIHAGCQEWTGRESAKDLFNVWRQMKQLCAVLTPQEIGSPTTELPRLHTSTPNLERLPQDPGSSSPTNLDSFRLSPGGVIPMDAASEPLDEETLANSAPKSLEKTNLPSDFATPGPSNKQAPPCEATLQYLNSDSPFKRVLFWPDRKETNTKRKPKEKVPSVATSEEWKKYYEKKEQEKTDLERNKNERKMARLENAKQKELKAKEKQSQKGKGKGKARQQKKNTDDKSGWQCYKCSTRWQEQSQIEKQALWITCNVCKLHVHKICISKKHIDKLCIDLSDSEDESAFLCEICNPMISSDDSAGSSSEFSDIEEL